MISETTPILNDPGNSINLIAAIALVVIGFIAARLKQFFIDTD